MDIAADPSCESLQPIELLQSELAFVAGTEKRLQVLQAEKEACNRLANLIMELSCNSTAFVFFRLRNTSKQLLSLQFGSLGLINIQNDAIYYVQVVVIESR